VLASLGEHMAEIGQQPLVIADENVWKLAGDQLSASFSEAGVDFAREVFGGVCSHREIDRITEVARKGSADIVVEVGGGTTLDTAKAAGHQAGIAWATPYRFLVSGMGDALATWVEARATAEARKSTMAGGLPTMAGLALAKLSWDTLIDYGFSARQAAQQHVVTPALEKVNFGTLTQFALEDRPTREFNEAATVPGETIHNMPFAVTPEMVVDAMVAADSYSRAYRQESGQQPAAASH
jgi:glycerol dehydrogenase